ncbi:MAG: cell division protein ZapA [Bacteroidetes bacterium]|nr:MAG: cell division protein ZapA [Bacteroidota bacterium]
MDEKFTIKVNIVDRYYPLKIDRKDEEKVRRAAKKINDTVLQYKKIYTDKDSQDFLAMAALQFVIKVVEMDSERDVLPIVERLAEIEQELNEYLEKEE